MQHPPYMAFMITVRLDYKDGCYCGWVDMTGKLHPVATGTSKVGM
jgi:hypothetical protein